MYKDNGDDKIYVICSIFQKLVWLWCQKYKTVIICFLE